MESDLFKRVSEMAQGAKGVRHDLAERFLEGASDNKSLSKNLHNRKKDILKQLDYVLLSNSLEMDLQLELTIIDELLKGE